MTNSVKHTPVDGTIGLKSYRLADQLIIEVKDNGIGIPEKDLPFIFDRFYQAKNGALSSQKGHGIGLSLTKELAKAIGGEISVKSKEKVGTEVIVTLPYDLSKIYDEDSETITEDLHLDLNLSRRDRKILIIDDNKDICKFIDSILSPYYETKLAYDGEEAYSYVQKHHVDLIISDIMMSNMDGYDLIEKLKASSKFNRIPIIVLSALSHDHNKLKALTLGADDYLTKPFSPQELLVRVSNLLVRVDERVRVIKEDLMESGTAEDELGETVYQSKVQQKLSKHDEKILLDLEHLLKEKMTVEEFRITDLPPVFNMSERTFQRKVKNLTGMTPKQYQQEVALNAARDILNQGVYNNLTAVAYSVGIYNASRFRTYYKARYGQDPSELL